jgi:hypothetical protein
MGVHKLHHALARVRREIPALPPKPCPAHRAPTSARDVPARLTAMTTASSSAARSPPSPQTLPRTPPRDLSCHPCHAPRTPFPSPPPPPVFPPLQPPGWPAVRSPPPNEVSVHHTHCPRRLCKSTSGADSGFGLGSLGSPCLIGAPPRWSGSMVGGGGGNEQ